MPSRAKITTKTPRRQRFSNFYRKEETWGYRLSKENGSKPLQTTTFEVLKFHFRGIYPKKKFFRRGSAKIVRNGVEWSIYVFYMPTQVLSNMKQLSQLIFLTTFRKCMHCSLGCFKNIVLFQIGSPRADYFDLAQKK